MTTVALHERHKMLTSQKILYVDLSSRTNITLERRDLFERYLGGAGVASAILLEETEAGYNPFSPSSPIVFAIGPLTNIFPCMSKTISMFKSPLTGNLGETHSGGNFSSLLSLAGYGALVIRGASDIPVYLEIVDDSINIIDATKLWGVSPLKVTKSLSSKGINSVAVCGEAGEHLVHYANVLVDRYFHFGRLGLGAIFGSKKLKAILIKSGRHFTSTPQIEKLRDKLSKEVLKLDSTKKYRTIGTAGNLLELNELGALPTANFMRGRFVDAEKISGELIAETMFKKQITCPNCPIHCIHLASLESAEEDCLVPYNYQPMCALGSNLLISDRVGLMKLIHRCEVLGLDAMMMGAVLGWITEAFQEGKITLEDTLGVKPSWGDVETYLKIIQNISNPENELYAKLAESSMSAAERYGGKEYVITLGGSSMSGYLTGYGSIVGTLVGARHSHLSNSGYSVDQLSHMNAQSIAEFLVAQEDWLYVLNSLVCCYFARQLYTPKLVTEALKTVKIELTINELQQIGSEIFGNAYRFKTREGFDITKQLVPRRLYEVRNTVMELEPSVLSSILSSYCRRRQEQGTSMMM